MYIGVDELVRTKGDLEFPYLHRNLIVLFMHDLGFWDRTKFLWRRWHYIGELDELHWVIFQCPFCKKIKVSYNHGREDKLKVWCDNCDCYAFFGYWKYGKT